ncbi:hypothetical protein NDU88_006980 [Pleurodeles waltl]|uniref:Uncharacterized protein n=1 Tax=Pleurodeles waltl TaxID=8319 RepID=A0AAV7PJZ4_PLEWA|nr:hypothetical protein NDU88_006980 [Pleurodeles waltl]
MDRHRLTTNGPTLRLATDLSLTASCPRPSNGKGQCNDLRNRYPSLGSPNRSTGPPASTRVPRPTAEHSKEPVSPRRVSITYLQQSALESNLALQAALHLPSGEYWRALPGTTPGEGLQCQGTAPPAVHAPMAGTLDCHCPQGQPFPRRVGPGHRTGPAPHTALCVTGPAEPKFPAATAAENPEGRKVQKSLRDHGAAKPQVRPRATGAAARLSRPSAPRHSPAPGLHARRERFQASASTRLSACAGG